MKFLGLFCLILLITTYGLGQSFGEQQILTAEADNALMAIAGDIDNDGDLDVISAAAESNIIMLHENDGNGNFSYPQVIASNVYWLNHIELSDFDADGDLDIINNAGNGSNDPVYGLYENDGTGTFEFQPLEITPTSWSTNRPLVAIPFDLDGNEFMDVATISAASWGSVSLQKNATGTSFFAQDVIYTDNVQFRYLVAGDLDGDGDEDLCAATEGCTDIVSPACKNLQSNHTLLWFENNNGIDFSVHTISHSTEVPRGLFLEDSDSDGLLDIILITQGVEAIIYQNTGGVFVPEPLLAYPSNTYAIIFKDLDGDGDLDLIHEDFQFEVGEYIVYQENLGGLGYNFGPEEYISGNVNNLRSLTLADLDGDGKEDLISASRNNNTIAWYRNTVGEGCMDDTACNYSATAVEDDGSCYYNNECGDPLALNYVSDTMCPYGLCIYVFGDFNGDDLVTTEDLSIFLSAFGQSCSFSFCPGDLNEDGIISISDFTLFLTVLGN